MVSNLLKGQCFINFYVQSDMRLKLTSFTPDIDSIFITKRCYKAHSFLKCFHYTFINKRIFSCLVKEGYVLLLLRIITVM